MLVCHVSHYLFNKMQKQSVKDRVQPLVVSVISLFRLSLHVGLAAVL